MKKNQYLNTLIENVYENCRVKRDERNRLIKYRDIIIVKLKHNLTDVTFLNQGSFSTFTQLITSDDLDVDIGIIFKSNIRSNKIGALKQKIYKILLNCEEIKQNFYNIKIGARCIKLFPKYGLYRNPIVSFEISIYKKIRGVLMFAYGNKWKIDNKQYQMKYLKDRLAENDGKREIVMFLKFIVSLHNNWYEYFKSIIILEFVIKNYPDDEKISISDKLILTLINFYEKVSNRFELLVSANSPNRENLLNNEFRRVDKNKFLFYLHELICNIYIIKINKTICYCCFSKWTPLCELYVFCNFDSYSEERNLEYLLCENCQHVVPFIIYNKLDSYTVDNIHSMMNTFIYLK